MSVCTICGNEYVLGGGVSHKRCQEIRDTRHLLDEAVAWLMSDDPDKGPMPELVARLRDEMLDQPVGRGREREGSE